MKAKPKKQKPRRKVRVWIGRPSGRIDSPQPWIALTPFEKKTREFINKISGNYAGE